MKTFEFIPEGVQDCVVRACLHTGQRDVKQRMHPAIIICPGGAYEGVSEREAEPVAKLYLAAGYNTFILEYATKEKAKNFKPLCQLAATIAHIRKYSEEWFTEQYKIAVAGFSAGGHLAASLGTLFNKKEFLDIFGREDNIRPDAMILGYPVITSDQYTHVGSLEKISGAKEGSKEFAWFGLDKHVDTQTPPTFLVHTSEDEIVPVENSLKMACALSAVKIPFELHILPKGVHGMSVCNEEVGSLCEYNGRWVEWSIKWLHTVFHFEA